MNNNDTRDKSYQTIDMLVDATLKRHGVELNANQMETNEKEQIKGMVNNLMKSVQELNLQDQKPGNEDI